jgi:hypothetical protein
MNREMENNNICRKCGGTFKYGKALVNTPSCGVSDFPGDNINSRGQTITMNGPAKTVTVVKCSGCGHSISLNPLETP